MRKLLALSLLFLVFSCQSESHPKGSQKNVELITPGGKTIRTQVVYLEKDQRQGLSGVQAADFADDQGMLFYFKEEGPRNFWMPDTYFDIDIIYLDKDLRVLDIVRKLPHYIGRTSPELIPRAREVWARHALEMKAGSPISALIKVDDVLKWKADQSWEDAQKFFAEQTKGE